MSKKNNNKIIQKNNKIKKINEAKHSRYTTGIQKKKKKNKRGPNQWTRLDCGAQKKGNEAKPCECGMSFIRYRRRKEKRRKSSKTLQVSCFATQSDELISPSPTFFACYRYDFFFFFGRTLSLGAHRTIATYNRKSTANKHTIQYLNLLIH